MVLFTCHFKFDMVEISRLVVYHQAGMNSSCLMRSHHCLIHYISHFSLALLPCCSLHMEIFPEIRVLEQSLAVLPNRAPLQVTSPTITLKWTTRRLRPCSSKEEQAELRFAIQVRTLPLDLHRLWECWLRRCAHRRARQVQTRLELTACTEKIPCQVRHFSDLAQGNLRRSSHAEASLAESLIPMQGSFRRTSRSSGALGNTSKSRSSRRTGSFIQTLWSGVSYENSSWRTKKPNTRRGKLRITSAGSESWACRQFDTNFEPTAFLSRCGNMQMRTGVWNCSTRTRMTPVRITEYIKKLAIVTHKKWKNWRERKICVQMNYLDKDCGKRQFSVNEITAQIQELQDEVICMTDST